MASRELIPPRLPTSPLEFDFQYMNDLVRAIETFIQQETNPGQMRGTKLTLTELPTSGALELGTLYRVGNEVRIVVLDIAAPDGSSGTGVVGSVTVVIS